MGACFSAKPTKQSLEHKKPAKGLSPSPNSARQLEDSSQCSNYLVEISKIPDSLTEIKKKNHSFNSSDLNDEYSDPILMNEASHADTSLKSDEIETVKKRGSFSRKRYLMARKSRNLANRDSLSTTNATKNSSDIQNNLYQDKIRRKQQKEENYELKIIINERKNDDPAFVNFGADDEFMSQLILASMKSTDYDLKRRSVGPRRLRQFSTGMNINPGGRPGNGYTVKLEIPILDENSGELDPSSSLISLSNIEVEPLKIKGFCVCSFSRDIELLDLENDGSKVHVFQIPTSKNFQQNKDYNLKTVPKSEFEYFYKTAKIDEKLDNSLELYSSFPNTWKNGLIPYVIEKSLVFITNSKNQSIYNLIINSIYEIQSKTSLKFTSYIPEKHSKYLKFSQSTKNHSKIGCQNGKNEITLTDKADKGVILHQMMHSFGFMHEYQRQKKDCFAYFSKDQLINVEFFDDDSSICIAGLDFGPYDYASIMHYRSCENMIFYKDTLHEGEAELSEVDLQKIEFFYIACKSENEIYQAWERMEAAANNNNLVLQKKASADRRLK